MSAETDDLDRGQVAATVRMRQAGVVVLSASFDPGWAATVDGRPQPTEMVAPALVATAVPAGTHRVAFSYHGIHGYPPLFALSALALAAFLGTQVVQHPNQVKELSTCNSTNSRPAHG